MALPARWTNVRIMRFSAEEAFSRLCELFAAERGVAVAYMVAPKRSKALAASTADAASKPKAAAGGEAPQAAPAPLELAVLTDSGTGRREWETLRGRIESELDSSAFRLIWLNEADPTAAYRVLRDGKPLHFRDAETLNEFERKAKKRYRDYKLRMSRRESERAT